MTGRPGARKTRIYPRRTEAELMATRFRKDGWLLTVQPSPDRPGAWGVRAERVFTDINENGVQRPADGQKPFDLLYDEPELLPGSVGRSQVVWMRPNGINFPKGE